MKDKSLKAGSDHHDEHPELSRLDALDEPQGTAAVSGEDPGHALGVEAPENGSANNPAAEQSGQEETGTADVGGPHGADAGQAINRHESSKRRRSQTRKNLERAMRAVRYLRSALVGLVGVIVLIVWVAVGIRDNADNKERDMEYQLNQKDIEIVKLRSTVEEQKASIESFVLGRLPGLTDLRFDRVFEVDHPYVRNITFTNVRTDKSNEYEFRIVLENDSSSTMIATPVIDVILFDKLGLETNRRKLSNGSGMNVIKIESLRPGDVRSYVDSFIVLADAKPAYFLVR
jgi:hypothetical protein